MTNKIEIEFFFSHSFSLLALLVIPQGTIFTQTRFSFLLFFQSGLEYENFQSDFSKQQLF